MDHVIGGCLLSSHVSPFWTFLNDHHDPLLMEWLVLRWI